MKKLVVLVIFLFLLGCSGAEQSKRFEKRWIGADKKTLIAVKGAPFQIKSDGSGGEIYTYTRDRHSALPKQPVYLSENWGVSSPSFAYHQDYDYHPTSVVIGELEKMFWIDPQGKIYKTKVSFAD